MKFANMFHRIFLNLKLSNYLLLLPRPCEVWPGFAGTFAPRACVHTIIPSIIGDMNRIRQGAAWSTNNKLGSQIITIKYL